ncbi:hypothetical protein OIU76_003135, partial [Salix suchowensis]
MALTDSRLNELTKKQGEKSAKSYSLIQTQRLIQMFENKINTRAAGQKEKTSHL